MNDDKRGPHGMGIIICLPIGVAIWATLAYLIWG